MKADLHVHSTASDGTLTPQQLVARASACDLDVLAITDHDSVEGINPALEAASAGPLVLIPAIELSSSHEGRDIHVLGYFIDPGDAGLLGMLGLLREARVRRARRMVELLAEGGHPITFGDVLATAGEGAVGRSHVARALVASGSASSVRDAFERLIGRDRPFYLAKESRTPAEAIATIRDAGGIAVVAHPGVNRADDVIPAMAEAGLSGIEAYHADHTTEQRARYAQLAAELGLMCTGGTDFHGPDAPNPDLGDIDVPADCVERLLAAGGRALR